MISLFGNPIPRVRQKHFIQFVPITRVAHTEKNPQQHSFAMTLFHDADIWAFIEFSTECHTIITTRSRKLNALYKQTYKLKSKIPTPVPLIYKVGGLFSHLLYIHDINSYLHINISLFVCLFAHKSHQQSFSFTRWLEGQLNSFKDCFRTKSFVCSWNPCCL